MGEDVAHGSDALFRRLYIAPPIAGKRSHATEQALSRPANQPDIAVPLNPMSDAELVPTSGTVLGRRKGLGIAACVCRASGPQRAIAAARILRTADGRAEVHHRLNEIPGPLFRH